MVLQDRQFVFLVWKIQLESWLQTTLDVDLETFEIGWRAWLREQIAQ